jgi:hypothetical protein
MNQSLPKTSEKKTFSGNHKNPSYENIPAHSSRPAAPDLIGKGKLPESQTFADDWFQEWNIDNLSIAQIRQMIDRMYVSYKIMCMKGKK